jgi:hypothetical protein
LVAWWDYPNGTTANAGQGAASIFVSSADPSTQVFFFNSLSGHYHQGSVINLTLVTDVVLATNDIIHWEWWWPGAGWIAFPGAAGLSNSLVAEQALSGVQVRATLTFGHTNVSMVAGPVTIAVDDHGAGPQQQISVTGLTSVGLGQPVTLTGVVLPATVINAYQWQKRVTGASQFAVIPGATSAQLTFNAALADAGAQYRVALVKPNGQIAYGPSPAVTLSVAAPDLSIALSESAVILTVATENGVTYQLESAPAVTGPWTTLGDSFVGSGQPVNVNVPISGEAGFFRRAVIQTP